MGKKLEAYQSLRCLLALIEGNIYARKESEMAPKLMPNMSLDQQIAGTRRAISTLRLRGGGPVWLIPSLSKRLRRLIAEKKRRNRRTTA